MKRVLITIITGILAVIIFAGCVFAATGKVNQGEVNFRSAASTEGDPIRELSEGEVVTIIEELDEWYKVKIGDTEGYVYKTYITKDAEGQATVAEPTTPVASNKTKLVSDAVIYVLPLLNSTKLETLPLGTEVEVISNAGSWSYIYTQKLSGWVISTSLESTKVSTPEKKEENTVANVTNQVVENTVVTNNTVSDNNTIAANTTADASSATESVNKVMYVTVEALNVREQADGEAEVIDSVGRGTALDVIAKEGNWYKVSLESGSGYVSADYVSETKPE